MTKETKSEQIVPGAVADEVREAVVPGRALGVAQRVVLGVQGRQDVGGGGGAGVRARVAVVALSCHSVGVVRFHSANV